MIYWWNNESACYDMTNPASAYLKHSCNAQKEIWD